MFKTLQQGYNGVLRYPLSYSQVLSLRPSPFLAVFMYGSILLTGSFGWAWVADSPTYKPWMRTDF